MKKQSIMFFAFGFVAGLLGQIAARKVRNLKILPDDLFDDMDEDWD